MSLRELFYNLMPFFILIIVSYMLLYQYLFVHISTQKIIHHIYIYIYIYTGGDKIPIAREWPVKSLGRLYSIPLTDWLKRTEVQKRVLKGFKLIDRTSLLGKMKTWCYQHGLLLRLLLPLQMYGIVISCVERIQQYSNNYLRKWFGVPPCFSEVVFYTNSGNLQLPISPLVE